MEEKILAKLGIASVLEQLAEEAAEVAQVALKMARIIRGENPTPKTYIEARAALEEELADFRVCVEVLDRSDVIFDMEIIKNLSEVKMKRWLDRLEGMRG